MIARRLGRLDRRAAVTLERAASSSGGTEARYRREARALLRKLLTLATVADGKGTLGVSPSALEAAVRALLALVPSP